MSFDTELTVDPFGWTDHVLDGRYRIDRVIGAGGFGVVYAAHHIALGGPVAVKCLDLRTQMDPRKQQAFLRAFQDEGRILHHLASKAPAVVRVLDLNAQTSPRGIWTPYLVLEWLDGITLHEYLHNRHRAGPPLTIHETIQLLAPVAAALDVAHASAIAHRDVKPANIFVLATGQLKILDFGIAKVMGDETLVGERYNATGESLHAFSPAYGAPEQFEPGPAGLGATGPWTDVYALALIVVEMLCGRRAYGGSTSSQFHLQATNRSVRPTPSALGLPVSAAVERALQRALAVEVRNRPASAGAFWRELEEAAKAAPASPPQSMRGATPEMLPVLRDPDAPTTTSANARTALVSSKQPRRSMPAILAFAAAAVLMAFGVGYRVARTTEETDGNPPPSKKVSNSGKAIATIPHKNRWTDSLLAAVCPLPCSGGSACSATSRKSCQSQFTCIAGEWDQRFEYGEKWYLHLSWVQQKLPPGATSNSACHSSLRGGKVCFRPTSTREQTCIKIDDACSHTDMSAGRVAIVTEDLVDGVDLAVYEPGDSTALATLPTAKYSKPLPRRVLCNGLKFDIAGGSDPGAVEAVYYFLAPR